MRTTVDLSNEQRLHLLELAAQRGEKGFSKIVREALDLYFETREQQAKQVCEALSVIGTLDDDAADELEQSTRQMRESWR